MGEVLRLKGVSKGFDRHDVRVAVFEDISLSVAEGEIVAVVAGPGQGKTTLIGLASGTLPPDLGRVYLGGVDVRELRDKGISRLLAADVGVATRSGPALNVTAREYIESALGAPKDGTGRRRWSRREQHSIAAGILEELNISQCASLRWNQLSDWQRVLVELAQAVSVGPRLLLVDDIARNFGLGQKQALMDVLEDFARHRQCGVLMAVSDHASALRSMCVWQVHRRRLRLMADHAQGGTDDDADVISMDRRRSDAR
jgi:ABC-type cobalamin/Fe3+-siderophores transport system ATPase subunit